ncbi:hypothetical protein BpHYR1_040325 [Brachionus plicatilis]|uniref:Uncharacterized protein n=1 Tax=Brachionus plicatilis TaxID=10195 RepID=A0A3M7PQ37_BRAPC|nr:hypothetical protein BpHYR1_040325 [Brachionus plicatilis]
MNSSAENVFFQAKANFLGSEIMDAFSDTIDGADACQDQIKKLISKAESKNSALSVNNNLLIIEVSGLKSEDKINITLPIYLLTYCGVFKQTNNNNGRDFESLEKTEIHDRSKAIFVATFRSFHNFNTVNCFGFYFDSDNQAMELVETLAKIYYEIVNKKDLLVVVKPHKTLLDSHLIVDYSDTESTCSQSENDEYFDNEYYDEDELNTSNVSKKSELTESNLSTEAPIFVLTQQENPKMIFLNFEYVQEKRYKHLLYIPFMFGKTPDEMVNYEDRICKYKIGSEIKARAEAKTLKELAIQKDNKTNKSGKDFILFDNGCEDEERILIVCIRENKEFLNSDSTINLGFHIWNTKL